MTDRDALLRECRDAVSLLAQTIDFLTRQPPEPQRALAKFSNTGASLASVVGLRSRVEAALATPPAAGEWRLVPVEPTEAMEDAGIAGGWLDDEIHSESAQRTAVRNMFVLMLAASPTPAPSPAEPDGGEGQKPCPTCKGSSRPGYIFRNFGEPYVGDGWEACWTCNKPPAPPAAAPDLLGLAVTEVLVSGNHLASALLKRGIFPSELPDDPEAVLAKLGPHWEYDCWVAWRAIMKLGRLTEGRPHG